MKFRNVLKGQKSEKLFPVPGYTDAEGKPFTVLLRPITGIQLEAAYSDARARAKDKGVTDPKEGEPIYDLALMAFIVAQGCVDPDSPENARTPSFASGVELLEEMHPETIVFLHEAHDAWQDETSPYARKLSGDEFIKKAREVAGPDGLLHFMQCSPSMRVSFSISTVRLLLILLEGSSTPGLLSEKLWEKSKSPLSPLAPQEGG